MVKMAMMVRRIRPGAVVEDDGAIKGCDRKAGWRRLLIFSD